MTHNILKIPLSGPDITAVERQAVLDVLETPHLSFGPKLPEFEEAMARYVGVRHAIAVNSGTSALQLIVRSLGIGDGDEVVTTPFSFIASANCLVLERAKPVFVDIDPHTYNIDVMKIESAITPQTKAILAVDVFGRCVDWDGINAIARANNLLVIEDSCEAIGAVYNGQKAGSFGDAGCFGFYPNKQMTTGEGGVIVTNRSDIASSCRSLRNQGREEGQEWLEHPRVGFNYRLSDINCALGLAQLSRIEEILKQRERVASFYQNRLKNHQELTCLPPVKDGRLSWFVFIVELADKYTQEDRDCILHGMREGGIGCSHYFPPIHLQSFYARTFGYQVGDFPMTENVSHRTLALPFFNKLSSSQVDEVVDCLEHQIRLLRK